MPSLNRVIHSAFKAALLLALGSFGGELFLDSTRTGRASFYHARHGHGACELPGTPPWDSLYVAVNKRDWQTSLACGACLMVGSDTDSVLVRVSDRCGGCKPGGLDLSPAAFRRLAPLGRGHTLVSWHYTACPDSNLSLNRTRGSSVHWSSLEVWGLPWPIERLSVASDTGWIPFHRQRYNHFTARKVPGLPWKIRMVDVRGRERVDSLLDLSPGATLHPDSSTISTDSVHADPANTGPNRADSLPGR